MLSILGHFPFATFIWSLSNFDEIFLIYRLHKCRPFDENVLGSLFIDEQTGSFVNDCVTWLLSKLSEVIAGGALGHSEPLSIILELPISS